MVKSLSSLFTLAFLLAGCTATEVPLSHDNPLDRIYDSGDFRIGLIAQAKTGATSLSWSNVYHKLEGALSDSNLTLNTSAVMLRSTGAPSATDITIVRNRTSLLGVSTAFTSIQTTPPTATCPIAAINASYASTCDAPTVAGAYYIIQFNYRFTDKSGTVTSGILYSNFVAVQ